MDAGQHLPATTGRGLKTSFRKGLNLTLVLTVLMLIALSTFHAVTTDRWGQDLPITEFFQQLDVGSFDDVLFWMGVRGVAGVIMAGAAAWLWLGGHRVASVMVILMLIPDASSFILRDIFERPRPSASLVNVEGGPQGFSFPSGTALHTMFFYGFMLYLLPKLTTSKRLLWGFRCILVLWILFQGAWVVHHGRHWSSDVVGGYLYGAFYLIIWMRLYPIVHSWDARNPNLLESLDFRLRRAMAKIGIGTGSTDPVDSTSEK